MYGLLVIPSLLWLDVSLSMKTSSTSQTDVLESRSAKDPVVVCYVSKPPAQIYCCQTGIEGDGTAGFSWISSIHPNGSVLVVKQAGVK